MLRSNKKFHDEEFDIDDVDNVNVVDDGIDVSIPKPKGRSIFFTSQVSQSSIGSLTRQIVSINEHDEHMAKIYAVHDLVYVPKPIKIYIDSYGGTVYQILGLLAVMESSRTPIHTIATGIAASCAFLMLISGHKRFAYKYATLMYHQMSTGVDGTLKSIQDDMQENMRLQKIIDDIISERTSISKDVLKEVFERKLDMYMSAPEGLSVNCIDHII